MVSARNVTTALRVIERLQHLKGRQRKVRIELLKRHRRNPILRAIFAYATDPRLHPHYLVMEYRGCRELLRRTDRVRNWRRFQRIVHWSSTGRVAPAVFHDLVRRHFSECSELERAVYQACLQRQLRVGIAAPMARQVWPDLYAEWQVELPKLEGIESGMAVVFYIRAGAVSAFSVRERPYGLLAAHFGDGLRRLCKSGVIIARVTSKESWEITDSWLRSKSKSISPAEHRYMIESLRLTITEIHGLSRRTQGILRTRYRRLPHRLRRLIKLGAIIANGSSRTGLESAPKAN